MDADRLTRLEAVFHDALERARAERPGFVALACAGDDDLRHQVMRLLEADDAVAAGKFVAATVNRSMAELGRPQAQEGLVLGPYRLLRELGSGGMGTVWLAERADDAYTAQVAVKLVRGGFADAELARRFRAERQILAELQHPGIGRLLDGGNAPDGTPYLVMEYVDGERITDYAERRSLTLRARLGLFRAVCEPVQYAHNSLVVHRDIKPSNILVEAGGVPKLVDFGIARPLQNAAETSRFGIRLTPAYASPEQLRGERVTVATDVYSLGILLFELLTGEHPLAAADAAAADVRSRALDDELPRPSHVAKRRTDRRGIAPRDLAGDLDNIVARATRKRAEARYSSVEQLSDDVRRYLEGDPVIARAPSAAYRARKFVRRHRLGVAAAAMLLLTLAGGLAATTWQAARAERARLAAVAASEQATFAKDFLTDLFRASDPSVTAGAEMSVRQLLATGTERIDALDGQPRFQADLLNVLGVVQINVGNYRTANELFGREIAIRRGLPTDSMLVQAINQRGRTFTQLGLPDSAAVFFREAVDIGRPAIGATHTIVIAAMSNLAIAYGRLGREASADTILRELIAVELELLGPDHVDRAYALNNLGLQLTLQGRYADAEPLMREALRVQELHDSEPTMALGFLLDNLGMMLREAGRYDESEAYLRRGLAVRRQVLGDAHRYTGESYASLGWMLALRGGPGDHAEADSLLHAALANYRANLGEEHPALAYAQHAVGDLEQRRGNLDRAEGWYRQALAIRRNTTRDNPRVAVQTLVALGTLQRRRDAPDSEALLREANALAVERLAAEDPVRKMAAAAANDSS